MRRALVAWFCGIQFLQNFFRCTAQAGAEERGFRGRVASVVLSVSAGAGDAVVCWRAIDDAPAPSVSLSNGASLAQRKCTAAMQEGPTVWGLRHSWRVTR